MKLQYFLQCLRLWCWKFYISSTIAHLLKRSPVKKGTTRIETMMNSTTRNIDMYETTIENLWRNFAMNVELSKVQRKMFLTLRNLHYSNLIEKHQHLRITTKNHNFLPILYSVRWIFENQDQHNDHNRQTKWADSRNNSS